jgi:hypothetical protein
VVDQVALAHEVVVDGLGAVAVGVEQEAAVVVGAVLGARAGLAVVAVAGVDAGLPERVHVLARRRGEADVHAARDRLLVVGRGERELVVVDEPVLGPDALGAERSQHDVVEAGGGLQVGGAEGDVVPHALRSTPDRALEPVSLRR